MSLVTASDTASEGIVPQMDRATFDAAEATIRRGLIDFLDVGRALATIREGHGYRFLGYPTFDDYLQQRWNLSHRDAYRFVTAAEVTANVCAGAQTPSMPLSTLVELGRLPAEVQRDVVANLDLSTWSRKDVRQLAKRAEENWRTRSAPPPPTPVTPVEDDRSTLEPDDQIDVALAEAVPWADGEIDLGITSPPYCLGEAVPYADGGDYTDYEHYRQVLVPAWCAELYRVSHPDHGRWCLNVPIDSTGPASRGRGAMRPRAVYVHWLAALEAVGFTYRTTILWHKGQAGTGTDRGTESPQAPHVVAPVEAIIVVYRGSWRRTCERPHDLGHEDWLQLCGPRGLWDFPGTSDPEHSAPYPEELPRRLIQLYSWRGDSVGDPFSGRGTTAAVAARLGRRVRACDRSAAYVDLTRRWVARERDRTTA